MRLLTVSHFFEDHGGGVERVAARLNAEFARMGHQAVWAASDADPAPDGGIEAVPLRCANPTERLTGLPMPIPGPAAIRALARAVRASDAVIVHDTLYVTSILATLLAKARGKPVVLIQHIAGIPFRHRALRVLMRVANRLVTRPMLGAADRLVFISDAVRRALIGEPARRPFTLAYNGVDTAIFHPRAATDEEATRLVHGLPADAPLALVVGRFVEKKGLAVVEALARRRPDLHVALVGAGPIRPEGWHLPNVHVLGPQTQARVAALYRAADLLLLPSVGEGYPLVVQEAMACGLPVICGADSARADPQASQWLRGVEIDLAYPVASAARCDAAIEALRARPIDAAAMTAYAARRYSWRGMAEAIVACVSEPVEALDRASRRLQAR